MMERALHTRLAFDFSLSLSLTHTHTHTHQPTGVTFTGWTPANPQDANIAPLTNRPLNLLSYGGVDWNQNGGAYTRHSFRSALSSFTQISRGAPSRLTYTCTAWSIARVQSVATPSNLDAVVGLGYDGIVIDAEESTEIVPIPEWNAMFDGRDSLGFCLERMGCGLLHVCLGSYRCDACSSIYIYALQRKQRSRPGA